MKQIQSRIGAGDADELAEGRLILLHAIDKVSDKLAEYFSIKITGKGGKTQLYLAEYETDTKDLAYIVIATIVRAVSKDGYIKAIDLVREINRTVYNSMLVRQLDNRGDNLAAFCERRWKKRGAKKIAQEKLRIAQYQKKLANTDLDKETTHVGAMLIDVVLKSGVNIIESKVVQDGKKSRTSVITYTEECFRMIMQSRELLLSEYRVYPIHIIEPRPWTNFSGTGGYQTEGVYKIDLVKARGTNRKLVKEQFIKFPKENLYHILNALQATKWQVNEEVFSVMYTIFDSNMVDPTTPSNAPKLFGGLPYNGHLDPEDFVNPADYGEFDIFDGRRGKYYSFKDKKLGRQYYAALEEQDALIRASNSRALLANMVLSNAAEYLQEEEIYFSYQYDYRGRIYPIQQQLQPQGNDYVKALLQFKDGCALDTDEAVRWFWINGANHYGFDKEDYETRIKRIKEKTEEIRQIAQDPIGCRQLWSEADSPFMFLAWCFEVERYLSNPDTFVSRLPVALDATCSGIQIYSGLLRDAEGARAVNVIGDTRNDIYQEVADKVEEFLATGDYPKLLTFNQSDGTILEVDTQPLADSLKGKISRKLTKRNTMTVPYSVTQQGMKDQLLEELQGYELNNNKFWVGKTWVAAAFLANLNARAIDAVVHGATVGQQYLKDVTSELSKRGNFVKYDTPLTGFPVVQRNRRYNVERIVTPVGKLSIRTAIEGSVDTRKMKSAVAPNFIHSLDAALLAETVRKLHAKGCTNFHMIHDSYGVPANYVVNLNEDVRETFVELFESDPLTNWYYQLETDHEVLPHEVMIDTLNLEDVRDSLYIFS